MKSVVYAGEEKKGEGGGRLSVGGWRREEGEEGVEGRSAVGFWKEEKKEREGERRLCVEGGEELGCLLSF